MLVTFSCIDKTNFRKKIYVYINFSQNSSVYVKCILSYSGLYKDVSDVGINSFNAYETYIYYTLIFSQIFRRWPRWLIYLSIYIRKLLKNAQLGGTLTLIRVHS